MKTPQTLAFELQLESTITLETKNSTVRIAAPNEPQLYCEIYNGHISTVSHPKSTPSSLKNAALVYTETVMLFEALQAQSTVMN